jgi:transposase
MTTDELPPDRCTRYPSDCSDEQWELIRDMFPVPEWTGNLRGTPRDPRRLFDAIRYKLRSGCAWNLIPHDFPSGSTVFKAYQRWVDAGIIDRVHDTLREMVRVMEDRSEVPTAGIIDSQSVKGSGNGGPSGFDGGKKVNGRKRHIIVDVLGLILAVHITAANVQDRDAAVPLIEKLMRRIRRSSTSGQIADTMATPSGTSKRAPESTSRWSRTSLVIVDSSCFGGDGSWRGPTRGSVDSVR